MHLAMLVLWTYMNAHVYTCYAHASICLFQIIAYAFSFFIFMQTRVQSATKLKKIIQDSKENVVESDVRSRMQPLKDLLINLIENLNSVFEPHVFIIVCRNFWDRMGQVHLANISMPYPKS